MKGLNNMSQMVYKHKDYYFEVGDGRVYFDQTEFTEFVENCRSFIQLDKENKKRERQELIGSKSK